MDYGTMFLGALTILGAFIYLAIYFIKSSDKKMMLLKVLMFTTLYSYALRPWLSKNITLTSDMIIVLLIFVEVICNKNKKLIPTSVFLIMSALILLGFMEIFNENIVNKLYSIIEFRKTILPLLGIPIGLFYIDNEKKLIEVFRFIVHISVPIIIYGIKQYFSFSLFDIKFLSLINASIYTETYNGKIRAISIFSGPFHFGLYCVVIFITASLLIRLNYDKNVCKFICIISIVGVFSTLTRINLIVLIVIVMLELYYFLKSKKVKIIIKINIIVIISMLLVNIVFSYKSITMSNSNNIYNYVSSICNIRNDSRLLNRIETWKETINMIEKNLFLGNGMGSSGDTLSQFNVAKRFSTSHNMYLKVFCEMGLIGLICFIMLLVLFLIKSTRLEKNYKIYYLQILIAININGLTGSTICVRPINFLFWMLLGTMFIVLREKRGRLNE